LNTSVKHVMIGPFAALGLLPGVTSSRIYWSTDREAERRALRWYLK